MSLKQDLKGRRGDNFALNLSPIESVAPKVDWKEDVRLPKGT
jgi:hypothetical protein